jgi:hypothetical protein
MSSEELYILDFDIENRPLAYLGQDFTTAEITAIAWSWVGKEKIHCALLDLSPESGYEMLMEFMKAYAKADIVTGHYIREHDLPVINGSLMEFGEPPLLPVMVQDTKIDLMSRKYISASQENLSEMIGVEVDKFHMTNAMWRESNRLTPLGLEYTRKRVTIDVQQHKLLREGLLEHGYLASPSVWRP